MFNNPNNPTDFPRVVTWYQSNVLGTIDCPSEERIQQAFTTMNNHYQNMISVLNTMASNMAYPHYPYSLYTPPPMNFPNPNFLNPPIIFPNTNTNIFPSPHYSQPQHQPISKPTSRAPVAASVSKPTAAARVPTPTAAVPATAPVTTPAPAAAPVSIPPAASPTAAPISTPSAAAAVPVSNPPTVIPVSTPPAPVNKPPTAAAPVKSQPTPHPTAVEEDALANEVEHEKQAVEVTAAVEEPATVEEETEAETEIGKEEVAKEPPETADVPVQSASTYPLTAEVEPEVDAPAVEEPIKEDEAPPKATAVAAPSEKKAAPTAKPKSASKAAPANDDVVGSGKFLVNYGAKFGYKPGICDLGIEGYLQLFNHRVFTSEKITQAGPLLPSEKMSLEDKTP